MSWALEFVLVEDPFKNLFKKTIMSKSWPFRGQWSHWWRWLYWGWWSFCGELGADDHQGRPRLPGKEAPLVTAANCNPSLPSLQTYICDVLFGSWKLKYSDRQYIWVVGGYWFVAGGYLHDKSTCWCAPKSTLNKFLYQLWYFQHSRYVLLMEHQTPPTRAKCKSRSKCNISWIKIFARWCLPTHPPLAGDLFASADAYLRSSRVQLGALQHARIKAIALGADVCLEVWVCPPSWLLSTFDFDNLLRNALKADKLTKFGASKCPIWLQYWWCIVWQRCW